MFSFGTYATSSTLIYSCLLDLSLGVQIGREIEMKIFPSTCKDNFLWFLSLAKKQRKIIWCIFVYVFLSKPTRRVFNRKSIFCICVSFPILRFILNHRSWYRSRLERWWCRWGWLGDDGGWLFWLLNLLGAVVVTSVSRTCQKTEAQDSSQNYFCPIGRFGFGGLCWLWGFNRFHLIFRIHKNKMSVKFQFQTSLPHKNLRPQVFVNADKRTHWWYFVNLLALVSPQNYWGRRRRSTLKPKASAIL